MGFGSSPRHVMYVYRYEAYTVSLAPISMICLPISIMLYALETSYQLLGHGKQFWKFHPYTIVSDPVCRDIQQMNLICLADLKHIISNVYFNVFLSPSDLVSRYCTVQGSIVCTTCNASGKFRIFSIDHFEKLPLRRPFGAGSTSRLTFY